ncbi:phage tail fiber C-terminal domain-containing protein [Escherichia coli]|nr:phage tail fiber C-terminal domain-containing protein [Escherichia coli]
MIWQPEFTDKILSRKPGAVQILDADKKQIQCVVRPLQILRADGRWENIGGMK